MNSITKVLLIIAAGVLAFVGGKAIGDPAPVAVSSPLVGSAQNTDILTVVSETSVVVGSRSTTVFAANMDRKYARCFNRENASVDAVWISFGGTASVGSSIYVPSSGSFEIKGDNLYPGIVTAINRTGTETGGTTASSSVRLRCQELEL